MISSTHIMDTRLLHKFNNYKKRMKLCVTTKNDLCNPWELKRTAKNVDDAYVKSTQEGSLAGVSGIKQADPGWTDHAQPQIPFS